jgi:replicative DNA helicase
VRDGFLSERDMQRLTVAAPRLRNAPLHINDASGLSILGLRTRARRMHQQHGIKLFIIDYLQLMTADRNRNDSRQNEVSMISAGCKGLAKDLNVPVIALSQLNRKLEDDKYRQPRLSDLRESGSLEQDADVVGMLYRPRDAYDDDYSTAINLLIAKQRNGPTGDVPLTFIRSFTRFESAAKVSQDDVPTSAPADTEPIEQQPQMI